MAAAPPLEDNKIYALINYEDPYVQPLIVAAIQKHFPPETIELISELNATPSKSSRVLQWVQYESINFEHVFQHSTTSLANAYVIRKALIRKHYLATTVANWIVKHPESVLAKHVKPSVEFEVDYAEFLDDALVEAWELHESWRRSKGNGGKDWWILKPGMSERGQGIRLFSSEEELTRIFEGWDPESDDEEEEGEDDDTRSDAGFVSEASGKEEVGGDGKDGGGIITSQLRHFIAQPYIHPPLLLAPPSSSSSSPSATHKFHIRTYVLATGALQIHVYHPMLALFAARPYTPPSSTTLEGHAEDALRAHLTNTCLQETGDREGSVGSFWNLPDRIPEQPLNPSSDGAKEASTPLPPNANWKEEVYKQICAITGEVFEAAARGMSIHFQALPNAFEIFGLDFMISIEKNGELRTWLLEVNAFPDFRQTGEECKGVVEGLMVEVVRVGIKPFFGETSGEADGPDGASHRNGKGLVKVLDIDLGRR
ncbi:uncharacterized protein N0V89_008733 [Didymosphaeria variabile]|uniref:TTL-domain-containing protein n=1 Tax=Didymosphaeria variabile TaxID=1932322 RepID=A0A9W8XHB1_9PLEO|nr:uncharacterized protein N0V89_008733 [Didymosphaeria variabile]KAJ4350112.1 hypothetical protein N0V89_008733 [Didymosphaeria variabile]